MIEAADTARAMYGQTQRALFEQILDAVRIAAAVVLIMSLGALFFPAMRAGPLVLLAGLVAVELGVTEASRWLVRRERASEGAVVFVFLTLIVAATVAVMLNSLAFSAMASGVLIAISALLIGPRYTLAPAVMGMLLFVVFSILDRQGWLAGVGISTEAWPALLIQIGFVVAATAVLVVVCMLASERLQRSAREAQERAEEAERAHAAQTLLNERLGREIDEQRRLLAVIQELETPLIPIRSGALVLPLLGHLDIRRLAQIERRLLDRVATDQIELVLIDITGVPLVDSMVAGGLLRLGQAVRLLGARVMLTGAQPAAALAMARLNVDLSFMQTYGTIQDALA